MSKIVRKITFSFDSDFILIGIVTSDNPYKLTWKINQQLKTDFIITEPLNVMSEKHPDFLKFPMYEYIDNIQLINYHLIANKTNDGFLLDLYKNADYLIKISGEFEQNTDNEMIMKLKTIENLVAVFKINTIDLKEKYLRLLNF